MIDNVPDWLLFSISVGTVLFSFSGLVLAFYLWRRSGEWVPLIAVPAFLYSFLLYTITIYGELQGVLPTFRPAYRSVALLYAFTNVVIYWVRLVARRRKR